MEKQEYLLYCSMLAVIRNFVNNRKIDVSSISDMRELYLICRKHNLAAFMANALEQAKDEMDEYEFKQWQSYKNRVTYNSALFDVEREEIVSFLEEKHIWYVLLKGLVIREYYPSPELREMSDNDILVDRAGVPLIHEYMLKRGYKIDNYCQVNDNEYLKPPVYNFEIHSALFDKDVNPKWTGYYENVIERLVKKENKYQYVFTKEDFYIYFIIHTYKHFYTGGIGLRTLLDEFLIMRREEENLDFHYINKELKKTGTLEFEKEYRRLAQKVFGQDTESLDELNDSQKDMLLYIFDSGTHGTYAHVAMHKMGYQSGEEMKMSSRLKFMLSRIFPKPAFFKKYYPITYKYKVLLPFAYIYRILKLPFSGRKKAWKQFKAILKK